MSSPPLIYEPLRDQVGRVLYEEPGIARDWYRLSENRREAWRNDADRILNRLTEAGAFTPPMLEAALEAGVDFLATSPQELFAEMIRSETAHSSTRRAE